jgi:hypothetical protein
MIRRLHVNRDLLAGLMFAGWGAAGLWVASDYPVGSALRMGPGYMPRLLCWGLLLVGIAIAVKGAMVEGEPVERWHWRPLVVVSAAILAFAWLLQPGGLVAATFAIVVIGAFGGPEFRPLEALLLAAGLALGAVLIFIYALKLPLPLWPAFLI